MAKSGQKRAFIDETVQDDIPKEELTVRDRDAVNYGSLIEASANKPGLWFSPEVWNDMASISDSIHNTRRHSRYMDDTVGTAKMKADLGFYYKKEEDERKRLADSFIVSQNMGFQEDLQSALEIAKRKGTPTKDVVAQFHNNYIEKLSQGDYPPYVYDNLKQYADNKAAQEGTAAITYDAQVTEKRATYDFNTAMNTGLSSIWLSGSGNNPNYSFDDYLADTGEHLFKLKDNITDPDNKMFNTAYNAGVLMQARNLVKLASEGVIDAQTASDLIKSLPKRYGYYDWTGKNAEGKDVSIPCSLEATTISSLTDLVSKVNNDKLNAQAIYGADNYKRLIQWDKIEKGDFRNNSYIANATMASAEEDFIRVQSVSWAAAGKGSESAIKQLQDNNEKYFTVIRPIVSMKTSLQFLRKQGLSDAAARTDLGKRLNAVERRINNPNDPLDDMPELIFETNGVVCNLSLPSSGQNQYVDGFYRNGVDELDARRVYYRQLVEKGRQYLSQDSFALDVQTNALFGQAYNDLLATATLGNAVRTSADADAVVPNNQILPALVQGFQNMQTIQKSISSDNIINAPSLDFISAMAKEGSRATDLRVKAAFYRQIGIAAKQAGYQDLFTGYSSASLNSEEQLAQNQMSMWSYLGGSPEFNTYSQKIISNFAGGRYPDPSLGLADNITKDQLTNTKVGGKLSDEIEYALNSYNIKSEYRPGLRYTLKQVAVASTAQNDGGKNDVQFDVGTFGRIIEGAGFTKNGTFRHSSALTSAGVSAEYADSLADEARAWTSVGLKGIGATRNDIDATVNSRSGQLTISVGGQSGFLQGETGFGNLRGTGYVPMNFKINNKPSGMSEGKYTQSVRIEVGTVTLAQGFTAPEQNAKIREYIKKAAPGMTNENVSRAALQFTATALDPTIQNGWMAYRQSNYGNQKVTAAPSWFKNAMFLAHEAGQRDLLSGGTTLGETLKSTPGEMVRWARNVKRGVLGEEFLPNPVERRETALMNRDEMSHYIDYVWSNSNNKSKVKTSEPISSYYGSYGSPRLNVEQQVKSAGWVVTSTLRKPGDAFYSGEDSGHSARNRTGIDVGFAGGFAGGVGANGLIKVSAMNSLANNVLTPNRDRINTVLSSRPELLSIESIKEAMNRTGSGRLDKATGEKWIRDINAGKYASHKGYSNMKNNQGKPLITYWPGHSDHLHIQFTEPVFDKTGKMTGSDQAAFVRRSQQIILTNVNGVTGYVSNGAAKALPTLFPNFKPTEWDAKNCGVPLSSLQTPNMAQVALGQRYVAANNALRGDKTLVWAGLAGARFRMQIMGQNASLVKVPDKLYNLQEVIDFYNKGGLTNNIVFYLPDSANNNYIRRVVQSARSMGG